VLYLGPDAVPNAAEAVAAARADGMRAAFVTNNASRRSATVARHLAELGIPAEPSEVVTSGQAAARWLAARLPPGSTVLVLGTAELAEEVAAGGMRPVRTADGALAVVQGLDPTTGWRELAEASVAIRSCMPLQSSGWAPDDRSWSVTGSTPMCWAPSGPERTACSC